MSTAQPDEGALGEMNGTFGVYRVRDDTQRHRWAPRTHPME